MFDVHFGEAFIVGFITFAVLSARYWPKIGEIVAVRLAGRRTVRSPGAPETDRERRADGG